MVDKKNKSDPTAAEHDAMASRRTFIKQVGGGVALLSTMSLPAFGGALGPVLGRKKVLVLGAGAAGLSAALALKKRGHKVVVIEYQNRIGGRLWSKQLPYGDQCTELGAGHFSGNMPLVNSLVFDRYNLETYSLNDGFTRYLMDGYEGNASEIASWPQQWGLKRSERNATLSTTLARYLLKSGIEDISSVLLPSWPSAVDIVTYGDKSVAQVLKEQGCSDGFLRLLDVHLGAPISNGDFLTGASSLAYFFNEKGFYRVKGGNDQIATRMAEEFGLDSIVLNAPVVAIHQTRARVRVTVSDGRVFWADKVVSTIPFKVLNEVAVYPAWSAGKSNMFSGMTWLDAFKGVIQLPYAASATAPQWEDVGNYGWPMAASDQKWNRIMDITGNDPGGYGDAFFYVYTEQRLAQLKAINASTNKDYIVARTQLLLDQFDTTPGLTNNLININNVVAKDSILWSDVDNNVPWIKSGFATGIKPWMRQEWSKPERHIHFAGDFTSYKSGWVEGALESGLRAAAEIDPRAISF